ncbi:Conserved_hypothetical protein [Hexamita inflata]|uniref:Leucine rich repeat protein n=1 Tax=Hexamita inflata TaxID=28002 RepID=A0AA86NU92_9EUKA|nr:Conserved hypothetical protein [Hexamita inflata]
MIQLTKLNLQNCSLKNVEPLKYLVKLTELYLTGNENIQIFPLQYLKQLQILDLEGCDLIDLTYLKPLTNLIELNIFQNRIIYLQPLANLTKIMNLQADINKIIDTSVFFNIEIPDLSSQMQYQFQINFQEQPNIQEIAFANQLRDINTQIDSLSNIRVLHSKLKYIITLEHKKVDKYVQQMFQNLSQFVSQVTSLFQQISLFQDTQ